MKKYFLLLLIAIPLPLFAFSLTAAGTSFKDVVDYTISILNPLFGVLGAIAFLVFFYGLLKFVIRADNEVELAKGKQYMMWGIIALFVLISFTAILNLLAVEFFGKPADFKTIFTNPVLPQ